jgi:hypothetical protein
MYWHLNQLSDRRLRFPEGEGDAGGAGGSGKSELETLKESNAALIARLEKLESSLKPPTPDPKDEELRDKARRQREADEKKGMDSKALEQSIKFNLQSSEFLKVNQSLLPKDAPDIFKAADKEKFENEIEKARAVKVGLIQSFFAVQENVDLLTGPQKNRLDEFLKLTKNGKQDQAQEFYENIFEPTFEALRRVKRAEALNRGHGDSSDDAYKQRLLDHSRKHILGEKI